MAANEQVGLPLVVPKQTTPESAADSLPSPATATLNETATQTPDIIGRLQKLGFAVVDVTLDDRFMDPALHKTTGHLTRQNSEQLFAEAFSNPDWAEARLASARAAVQKALDGDKGTVTVARLKGDKHWKDEKPAVMAAGVTEEGRVFVAAKETSRGFQGWRASRQLLKTVRSLAPAPKNKKGITANLLPKPQRALRRAFERMRTAPPLERLKKRRGAPTPMTNALTELNPRMNFLETYRGYTLAGYRHTESMLDPNAQTHEYMIRIARTAKSLGRHALKLPGREAADLFGDYPEIWQSLLAVTQEAGTATPDRNRKSREILVSHAQTKLEQLTKDDSGEQLTAQQLAIIVGAGVLARHSQTLRQTISTYLASRHVRPDSLPKPNKPTKPSRIPIWQRIKPGASATAARAKHRQNRDEYKQALEQYHTQMARYNENQRATGEYDKRHEVILQRGGEMLSKLLEYYTRRSLTKENVLYWDSNSRWGMEDLAKAIQNPATLPSLYERVNRERKQDRRQLNEKIVAFTKGFWKGRGPVIEKTPV